MRRINRKMQREAKKRTDDHADGDEGEKTEDNPHRSGGHGCLNEILTPNSGEE